MARRVDRTKSKPNIVVFNRKSCILTRYSSIRHFLKDIFNRDFSLDWDNAFTVIFNKEAFKKFSSHKFRKVVVSVCKTDSSNLPDIIPDVLNLVDNLKDKTRLYIADLKFFKEVKKIALNITNVAKCDGEWMGSDQDEPEDYEFDFK